MFETILTLIICGLVLYAFWQQRKPPSQRRAAALGRQSQVARSRPAAVAHAPLGPLIRAALHHHRQQLRGFVDGLLGRAPVIPMSTRLLPPPITTDADHGDTRPQKRETRNETGAETDIKLGQKRIAGVVALAAAGMDEAQIWAVVQKEPAALVAALKLTAGRNVAAVMEGATAGNMELIREIKQAAEVWQESEAGHVV